MSRISPSIVLALVLLMALPVRATGAGPGSAGLPSAVLPTEGQGMPVANPTVVLPGETTAGASPVAVYPSDALASGILGTGSGPTPTALTSAIDRHGFRTAWAQGFNGNGVTAAIIDQGLDFGHPDLNTSYAVEPNPNSPYYGWPEAFDPKSMLAYIRTGIPEGTWYANTSRSGPGPFEITHKIKVDGTNDFGQIELVGTDPRENGGAAGDKEDYDLTDLYMTRDADNWYFGFTSWLRQSNDTYVILIDTNNETGGTTTVPAGEFADTNTSHADIVTDIAYSPNGTQIATVGADRYLRVWDRATGRVLFSAQVHTSTPYSVVWSPDGTRIATADPNVLIIWNAATGRIIRQIQYVPGSDPTNPENAILDWSPDGSRIAAGTAKFVHIFDGTTYARVGVINASTFLLVNAVRFSHAGNRMAVGLSNGAIPVYNASAIQPYPPVNPSTPEFTLPIGGSGHTNAVLDLAWSPNDQNLVSGGKDNKVVLWDMVNHVAAAPGSTASGSWVTGVEWRKDGNGFVTVSAGLAPLTPPRMIFWNLAGNPVTTITMHGPMTGVDTSPAGEVATSSADLTARTWSLAGAQRSILVFHKPDFAIVANGWSRYSDRDTAFVHGLDISTFYRWNSTSGRWEGMSLFAANGTQASFDFGSIKGTFNEFSIPRWRLGDPSQIAVEMFSAGQGPNRTPTKPQDSVPNDPNDKFLNLDFTPGVISLGAFAFRQPGSYTIDPAIVSRSGTFHFGYHPSPILTRAFGPIGLLVVDSTTAGVYDTVYVDLNNDHDFDLTDVKLTRDSPVASLDSIDHATGAPGRDGIPDVSGGLLYFISNGTNPIPYSNRYLYLTQAANPNLQNRIPGNGDLLAFMGEFGLDAVTGVKSDHGTRIASLLVGEGLLNPPAQGVAPKVKLMAVGNGLEDVITSWYFAVEGYDGTVGTGDEAQVVLSPFNYPTLANEGFDIYSRTADYISHVYSGGRAVFVAPSGEYGFGYSTVASPGASAGVLSIGRVEDGTATSKPQGGTEGPNAHYLDVAMSSARGPSLVGVPKPDMIAIGTATSDIPLQSAPGDGATAVATAPMTGTDVAATVVAGAAAIVMQAFHARWNRNATVDEATEILRSSAVDLSYDAFVQGSGFLDVAEAVRLAAGKGGFVVSPSTLLPGEYRGNRPTGYTHLIEAGTSDVMPLQVQSRGVATTTFDVSDAAYVSLGSYSFRNSTVRDLYSPNGDITFWLNATGVSKVNGTTLATSLIAAAIPGAWASADLVKVTATSAVDRLVLKTPAATGATYSMNYSYTLTAMDWQANMTNWGGLPYGPFPAPSTFPSELNTITRTSHIANVLEVRVEKPATSVHDGLAIRLGETQSGSGLADVNWTFTVELFRRADWAWVTPSPGSVTLSSLNAVATISVNVSVPANAGLGLYEGFVLVTNRSSGRTAAVPIVVNVGTTGTDFRFGGNPVPTPLYDTSRFFGGNDFTLNSAGTALLKPYMGDWRYYYIDLPDNGMFVDGRGLKLIIDFRWNSKPSDLDIQVYSRTPADTASTNAGDRYGPAPIALNGKTEELPTPDFKTATNSSEDVLTVDLRAGLNVIAIHVTRLKGDAPNEWGTAVAGWARVRPSVDVSTPNLAGDTSFTFLSSFDFSSGLRASAIGPATTTSFVNEPIPQDYQSWWNYPNFGEFLWRGSFNYTFNMTKALILDVHLVGAADVSDLDLGVFRDMNGNGKLDLDEVKDANSKNRGGNDWFYSAGPTANEEVKWLNPPDGQYFVKVLGFTVNANPGHFNLDIAITLATGKGYEVPQAPKPTEIIQGTETGLHPFTPVSFTMAWDLPGDTEDGDYGGGVLLGLPNAPGVLLIPVNIGIDRVPPTIAAFSIAALNGLLDVADNRTTTDLSPTMTWTLADPSRGELDSSQVYLTLDGADVTAGASVSIALAQNSLGAWGFWDGTVTYVPGGLSEGVHQVELTIGDFARNTATQTITIIVDKSSPPLVVEGAALRFTTDPFATLTAMTYPGGSVSFGGAWIPVGASGEVTTSVSLQPGVNPIRVTAADWFGKDSSGNLLPGNPRTATVTVVRDNIAPTFIRAPSADFSITRADAATIRGKLQDYVADGATWPASDLVLTVAGTRTPVEIDGTFTATVPLVEGTNVIAIQAVDLAGNSVSTTVTVERDSTAPLLELNDVPGTTTTGSVNISGRTDPTAIVFVNGLPLRPLADGTFSREVTLSGGSNVIVVRAEDAAGNAAEQRVSVVFTAESTPLWEWISIGVTIAVVVFLLAFLAGRNYLFPPGETEEPGEEPEEEPEEETPAEEELEPGPEEEEAAAPAEPEPEPTGEEPEEATERDEFAQIEEESAPVKPAPPAEDPRAARLRQAFESGKISREVYEANLRRISRGP